MTPPGPGPAPRAGGLPGARAMLDPTELAKLASLAIRCRVVAEGAFTGLHHNRLSGSSIEFAEHKEYAPGDDVRHIDWKAAARIDRLYIKRFEDETEMRTYLVLDASASMGYRRVGISKLEYAGLLAGALAYLLAQQGDPAGLLLFDERTRNYLPPGTRPGHIRDLLALIDGAYAAGRTGPEAALAKVGELAERRSLIILFSDLLDAAPSLGDRLRQLRTRGHDVVLFHVLDPDEIDLPFDDLTHFEAVEPGDDRKLLGDPRDLRAAFRKQSQVFRDGWRERCLDARVEHLLAVTSAAPSEVLRRFLLPRQRGRRAVPQ